LSFVFQDTGVNLYTFSLKADSFGLQVIKLLWSNRSVL